MTHRIPINRLYREYDEAVRMVNELGFRLERTKQINPRSNTIENIELELQHYINVEQELRNYAKITYHKDLGGKV